GDPGQRTVGHSDPSSGARWRRRPDRGPAGVAVVTALELRDPDRTVTFERDPLHPAAFAAVVEQRVVHGAAVVPEGDVTRLPVPAHLMLEPRGRRVQHVE